MNLRPFIKSVTAIFPDFPKLRLAKISPVIMRNLLLVALLFTTAHVISAQKLDISRFENMKARSIGPAGMSGRITAIDAVHSDPDVIYVGAASGGVWKSESGGIAWEPIFNKETTASVGAIAIQQSNPSVIWVGTGEGNPRNSLNGGDGIYKSLDGGKTWKKMGLAATRHIHRIIIDPTNPNTVYAGAIGSPWGEHPERGLYKTTDGGKTWSKILFANNKTGVADMVMDPTNPNKLIVALWEHKRDPWFFKSGGPGSGLHITYDGGETWKQLSDKEGLPKGELGRIGLAIAPSKPKRVYAIIEAKKNAFYRSDDGGEKWTKVNDKDEIGNRPFYYSDLYVDPSNENRVFSIFTYVNVTEDGGKSFKQLMPAYNTTRGVHPDHHSWWIHPTNADFMMDGNDGGLNITKDRGKTWRFVENLPVGQFYHIAVDNEYPYNVYGGMQDNGSWAGPAYVWKAQGIRNNYWQEISFGDGFDVLPDPDNSRIGISTAQQGFAGIYDRQTGSFEIVRPTYPEGDVELRFNWNVGMARDPFNSSVIYFGSQFVHKSTDRGQSWEIISPDLTTNDPEKQKQGESGGLTMDATGAENYCTILVISPSPTEEGVLWVGTDDGRVHVSRNGGNTWTDVSTSLPDGVWVTQIKPSTTRNGYALLVANDYRRYNYEPMAYRTTDYGQTWERIVDGNDVSSYALAIIEDPVENRLKFLGTDDGLYVSVDDAQSWVKWTAGFPTTNAMDLIIHPREHDLVIGTFGRAIYVLDDIRPLREVAAAGTSLLNKQLHVFDPPTAYNTAIQQATGTRFGADATFNGENRRRGALLTYVINKPEEEKTEPEDGGKSKKSRKDKSDAEEKTEEEGPKIKYDSIKVEIFNAGGDLIRTLKQKAPDKNGVHRMSWNLNEKGFYNLSRNEVKKGNDPNGVTARPGEYKVRFTFGDQMDSTILTIAYDPRLNMSSSAIEGRYQAQKEIEAGKALAFTAVERLKESMKLADDYAARLKAKDEEGYKEQIDLCKTTKDTLSAMLDLFVGKEDKRQGITRNQPNSVNAKMGNANFYTGNATHAPGSTERALISAFQQELNSALSEVNAYYEEAWPAFRETLEAIDLTPFKDYQKIE